MENVWNTLQRFLVDSNLSILQIPLWKVILFIAILTMTAVFQGIFCGLIIKKIEGLTHKTNTKLDDSLIEIIQKPLGWLIFLSGLWIIELFILDILAAEVREIVRKILSLITIAIVTTIIYRTAPLLGELLGKVTARTNTELDDLLVPYFPKLFQTAAIVVVIIKASEVVLGASAGALIGLLGGAGVALGLLFKEIIYDWCCTVIIYLDGIYRVGDELILEGVDGFAQVVHIGLRSTKLRLLKWDAIQKIPNSRMITGIVENRSQNPSDSPSFGINLTLKIDGISASKTAAICNELRTLPNFIDTLHERIIVWFDCIQGNARVIKIRAFVNGYNQWFYTVDQLNLVILELLEKEGIDMLDVNLMTSPERYKKNQKAINNEQSV
ncbi:MAG TPA: mechanosensitive ion channel domain-containing protein [Coleofasciculaceae cyanobacterium]